MTAIIQITRYRIARRENIPTGVAARACGIGLAEARMINADDARTPPPAGAYVLPRSRTGAGRDACAVCHQPVCDHADAFYQLGTPAGADTAATPLPAAVPATFADRASRSVGGFGAGSVTNSVHFGLEQ